MRRSWMKAMLAALAVAVVGGGCKKEDGDQSGAANSKLFVRMVDEPSPYGFLEINVDVRGVEVNITSISGNAAWVTLNAHPGVYNLLELANGFERLIGDATVPPGNITQVRLALGENNSVKLMAGNTLPLTIPAAGTAGLIINVNQWISVGQDFVLYLDFDAAHSVVPQSNLEFHLYPVLRGWIPAQTGGITGGVNIVGPGIAAIAEKYIEPDVKYSTYVDLFLGRFMLRGLPPGKYRLMVYAVDSDIPFTIEDIEVTAGNLTDVGTVIIGQGI